MKLYRTDSVLTSVSHHAQDGSSVAQSAHRVATEHTLSVKTEEKNVNLQ